jgi:type I restriction enzyme S subunit
MELATFFEKFDQFADAPNAVAKMRELVLQLAVQGRLVEPPDDDAPVDAFLRHIWKEKADNRFEITDAGKAQPFDLPAHWRWVMLAEVADFSIGKTPPRGDSSYWYPENHRWVSIADMKHYGTITETKEKVSSLAAQEVFRQRFAEPGSILMSFKLTIGKVARAGIQCFHNEAIISLKPPEPELADYLFRFLPIFAALQTSNNAIKGSTLNKGLLTLLPIALPPLTEQKRIVAKVDELMALCDRLEAQQQERATRHAALARAALTRFADAPTPANLNLLFHPSYPIALADIRKAILTLAVQGKLVPQNLDDGETITLSIETLVGRKYLKNGLSLTPTEGASDFVCLPLSAMKGSTIDCSFGKPIAITSKHAEPYLVKERDVFIIRGNGSKDRVGIAGMVRSSPPNVLFPDLFIRVPLPSDRIEAEYFLIAWNSPVTRVMLESLATTTSGIWKVNQGHISECEIPLPPLAEQRRIVAKVDQLMTLVDRLEAQLAAARAASSNLLEAAVAELTVGG